MSDPFQDVDSGGAEFVKAIGDALEVRAAEATMQAIVDGYLGELSYPPGGLHVEIGAGTGAIARKIAAHAKNGQVIGSDLSPGLIEYAKSRTDNPDNLSFEVATGAELRFETGTVDTVIMHTVLSHVPDPSILLAEAARVIKPTGTLVICDGDFAKASIANTLGDPLGAFAVYFADNFVTDKYLVGKLQGLVTAAGFLVRSFDVQTRV
ncbi:MAG: class I SAM-dependent methyltransferase, partial [Paracoccaceae bacterium]